jgi:hypothetical protein
MQVGVREYWREWPAANIGIVIPTGFFVLDIDAEHNGFGSLSKLQEDHDLLPPTWLVSTGSGGLHYWYKAPGVRNTTALAGYQGIDVRGVGGYVVAPPSLHRSGRRYEFADNSPVADAPAWLVELVTKRVPPADKASPQGQIIPEGERNSTLASLAGTMRRRGMTAAAIEAALLVHNRECCQPPLPEEDVKRIAASYGRYSIPPTTPYGFNNTSLYIDANKQEIGSKRDNFGPSSGQVYDSSDKADWGVYAQKFDEVLADNKGPVDKRDVAGTIGLSPTGDTFRKLLSRRIADGKVRRYRGSPYLVEWINREYQITRPDKFSLRKTLDIRFPLGIHELVEVPPRSVIGVAGYTSAGKTAFLLECAELNVLHQDLPVYYWYNEMSEEKMVLRWEDFPALETYLETKFFPVIQTDFEFADVLQPDAINIIDYLDRDADVFMIGDDIKKLYANLSRGILIFAIQKPSGRDLGYGGLSSAKQSSLYISLDIKYQSKRNVHGEAQIIKAKDWSDPNLNPVKMKCSYITGGKHGKLMKDGDWTSEGR